MVIQILLLLISIGCLYSQHIQASIANEEEQYDSTEERVVILLGTYLRDNHIRIKNLVLKEKPLGENKNYSHLSEADQERFEEFTSSRLIIEATQALPFTEGALISAFMNIQHLDPLSDHQHKEAYRYMGISDDQIQRAKDLIQQNFKIIEKDIERDLNRAGLSREHLRQALGGEIIRLLQDSMDIKTEEALEIFNHLQRLERRDFYKWAKENGTNEDTDTRAQQAFSLDLLKAYQNISEEALPAEISEASHLQRHWKSYMSFAAAGLSIGGLCVLLSDSGDH